MAHISQITDSFRLQVDIVVQPWFKDHCFAGKVILPAVETLLILAGEIKKFRPECNVKKMVDARFDKMLEIDPNDPKLNTVVEIDPHDDGSISAKLLTKIQKKTISRIIEHGRVTFASDRTDSYSQSKPLSSKLKEPVFKVTAEKIYQELVPFGKAYRNITNAISVSEEGVWARLRAPDLPLADIDGVSGSPFPLDAAFHAACVWGQRFVGFIPFPVGFASRTISKFTELGHEYQTRVIPTEIQSDEIIFDLWIYDPQGELFETVCGLRMRDVSGRRIKPPAWIVAGNLYKTLQ